MKRFTITLFSLFAITALATYSSRAYAQDEPTGKITFKTTIEEGGNVNLIFRPKDKVKVTGAHAVLIGGQQAWEVDNQEITLEGPINYFDCNMSRIVEISFENCEELEYLCVNSNPIKKIDLTGLPNLEQFMGSTTELSEVKLGQNDALLYLYVGSAQLSNIDLSGVPNLEKASFSGNLLSSIDLSGLNSLEEINLAHNQFETISVSGLPELMEISLNYNPLTEASFSSCPSLEKISAQYCKLVSFTAKDLEYIQDILLHSNQLSTLSLDALPELYSIDLSMNKLSSVDFSKCNSNLTEIELNTNNFSGTFKLENMPSLEEFSISHNKVTQFEVVECPSLISLNVESNELKSLDLSGCTSGDFSEVYAQNNKLTSVKLGNSHTTISLGNNQLSEIDLSTCPELTTLDLSDNKFTKLDFTGLEELNKVYVFHNQISEPNMDKLIETLYTFKGKASNMPTLYAVQTRSSKEENLCSAANVAKAAVKKWNIYDKRTNAAYNGAKICTITCKTEGKGGKIRLNGKEQLDAYTDTRVIVDVMPEEGYGLDSLWYRSREIFNDQAFWVTADGEVKAKFTDKICNVVLERFGHGILKLEGEKFDLKRMPIGRSVKVIAEIYDDEEDLRELATLTANDKDIMSSKEFTLDGDVKVVAKFDWIGEEGKDPYDGEYYCNIKEITRNPEVSFVLYPNPTQQQIFIENAGANKAIAIYTLEGLRMMSNATDATGRAILNVENLANGVYVVVIGNTTKRMIVHR